MELKNLYALHSAKNTEEESIEKIRSRTLNVFFSNYVLKKKGRKKTHIWLSTFAQMLPEKKNEIPIKTLECSR